MTSKFTVARKADRIHVNLPVTLRVGWQGCMEVSASMLNLSEHGARVRATVPFRLGQDVELKIDGNETETRAYRVVWVQGTDPVAKQPIYEAGLELCS